MLSALTSAIGWSLCILATVGGLYSVLAAEIFVQFLRRPKPGPRAIVSVSVIKPLHGADPWLAESLESYLRQDYPGDIQIIFGVKEGNDPAVPVVRDLIRRNPGKDILLIIDERSHGPNRKVSNLANILERSKHDILIMCDADLRAPPNYVSTIVGAIEQPGVGAVTCPYLGLPAGGFWSRVAAMSINYDFLPSAILAKTYGLAEPCFGPTIAVTRSVLEEVGGITAFSEFLAEDFEIGRAVRNAGYSIAIPSIVTHTLSTESSISSVFKHELRWARTIRRLAGPGHIGSVVTHPLALALLGGTFLGWPPMAITLIFAILGVRIATKLRIDAATGANAGPWWLFPLRDMLSFGVFLASFSGNVVEWQGQRFRVGRDGVLSEL